jgi:antitoxin HicB
MLQTFRYCAAIEPGDEAGFVVGFPDVPEAITQGATREEAIEMASDALGLALLVYAREGRALPKPRARGGGLTPVAVVPEVAAKLALLDAFARSGVTKVELGRRLKKDEKEIRRMLDPMHRTKLSPMNEALAVFGRRLVVGVEEIAA